GGQAPVSAGSRAHRPQRTLARLVTSVNWYPKKWEILRRGGNRLWDGNPWYPEKQFIWLADGQIKAMNPAHILYLVYTGRDFRGLARTRMDEAS
ncbi:hypothetical protein AAIH44_36180, partial [Pseudomonas aeruginosa]